MRKKSIFLYLYIIILGLTPLIWFQGELITGTDVDFPLFPAERFYERLYTWFPKIQLGIDRSNNVGSLPFVALSAIFSSFGLSIITVEKLSFVFWHTLTGFSMLFLVEKVFSFKKREDSYEELAKYFIVLFYMVNFYLMFVWVRLQLAVLILAFVPILLGVFIQILEKNKLTVIDLLIIALFSFLSGPLGIQPPIIYALIIGFLTLFIYYLVFDLVSGNFCLIVSKVKKLFIISTVCVLVSSYWIFPLYSFINSSGLTSSSFGEEIYNTRDLLAWTSKDTSFFNILRHMGDVVWFDSWGEQPYFPEFLETINNPVLVVFTFLVPFGFIYGIKNIEQELRRPILGIAISVLISLFFAKGLHSPFGVIFDILIKYFPGFWIHRAPWQKFTVLTMLSFSLIGGIGVSKLLNNKLSNLPKLFFHISILTFMLMHVFGHEIFVTGKMFPNKTSEVGYHGFYNLGFHHTIPEYVYDFRQFMKTQNNYFNILVLPDMQTNVYSWGYAGSSDILPLLIDHGSIFRPYGEGFTVGDLAANLYSELMILLYENSEANFDQLISFFNIGGILLRRDFRYDFYGEGRSTEAISQILSRKGYLSPNVFGNWEYYPSSFEPMPLIDVRNVAIDVSGMNTNILKPLMSNDLDQRVVLVSNPPDKMLISEVYLSEEHKTNLQMIDTFIPSVYWERSFSKAEASVNPKKIYYPLVTLKENLDLWLTNDTKERLDLQSWLASKRIYEIVSYNEEITETQKNERINNFLTFHKNFLMETKDLEDIDLVEKFLGYFQYYSTILLEDAIVTEETKKEIFEIHDRYKKYIDEENNSSNKITLEYSVHIENSGVYEMEFLSDHYFNFSGSLEEIVVKSNEEVIFESENLNDLEQLNLEVGEYVFLLTAEKAQLRTGAYAAYTEISDISSNEVNFLKDVNKDKVINNIRKFKITDTETYDRYLLSLKYEEYGPDIFSYILVRKDQTGELDIVKDYKIFADFTEKRSESSRICEMFEMESCDKVYNIEFSASPGYEEYILYTLSYVPKNINNKVFTAHLSDLVIKTLDESFHIPNLVMKKTEPHNDLTSLPTISFEKLNPTKYKVHVSNIEAPFYLVFNQTYNNNWVLEGEKEYPHVLVNHVANGWFIDPDGFYYEDEMILRFKPQRHFYFGLTMSFGTLLAIFIYYLNRKNCEIE